MFKKYLAGGLVLLLVNFISGGRAFATITGSEHDFKGKAWNSTGQICVVCHTPHNSLEGVSAPLWNHTVSTATYTPYSSTTLNASVGAPSGSSKACLSCHDGTVALNAFGGGSGSTYISGSAKLGTDLSNDHPVSYAYDSSLATTDGALADPSAKTVSALGGKTIAEGMLKGGKVECGSCHDVHANRGNSATSGKLLLVDNTGSALCLTCHSK